MEQTGKQEAKLCNINLQVTEDMYKAFQRCMWVVVNETGKSQLEVMSEIVHDFLVKNGC